MSEWMWLLLGGPILALIIRRLTRVPHRPKLLHTPYARPGPWHILKIIAGRIWLAWKHVKHPRVLNIFNVTSKKYENVGIVSAELERVWELPHLLHDRESLDGLLFYGTDGKGTFLRVSVYRQINRQAQVSLLFVLPDGTTYRLPGAPDTQISNTDGREVFNAGGVKFQMIEPMRRWRIIFNGFAKRISHGEEKEVHLRINMIWACFSRPFEFKREFSRKLLAQGMARELWRGRQEWSRMSEPNFNGTDQWGAMFGTYQESDADENRLYLRGLRQRRWGQSNASTLHRKIDLIGSCDDGHYFYISATSDSSRLTHEVWGHLYHPSGFLYKINACNLDMEKLGETGPVPKHFTLRFSAKRRNYHAIVHLMPNSYDDFIGRPWRHRSNIYPCHLTLNAKQGRLLLINTNTFHGTTPLEPELSIPYHVAPPRKPTQPEAEKLVLLFNEEACRFDELVGGKGASLAVLSSNDLPIECTVPLGFCVTANAWRTQTSHDEALMNLFKKLEDVAKGTAEGDLKESCDEASNYLLKVPINPFVKDCVKEALQELFGEEFEQKLFAVRSSGIGEDSEEASSAGQNATVLGCKGLEAIHQGLRDCWASLVTHKSVEYRRQHGEPLIPGMGVVIQEMVDAESAGVLFTVNPNNGDPGRMILTANFGLGESVVSACAEPDTFYVKRTSAGDASIEAKTIGSKRVRVVLTDSGTKTESVSDEEAANQCLADDVVLELAKLGVYLENAFGRPRDLEFAVANNSLFLLQARPVTSLDAWTEYELRHEFDSPILTDADYVTKASTGKVAPGAATPLSLSVIARTLELNFQATIKKQFGRQFEVNPWYAGRLFAVNQSQIFINVVDAFLRDVEEEVSDNIRAIDMAVFGHIITTPAMHRLSVQRFGVAGWRTKLKRYKMIIQDLFFSDGRVKKAETKFSEYDFPIDRHGDSQKLYDEICHRLPQLVEIGRIHAQVNRASALKQLIVFNLMLDGRKEWTPDRYSEMAHMFSSITNVESADIPVALKELARAIADEESRFASQSVDEATEWLRNNSGTPGKLFKSFITRHGHRSIKEFELHSETWGLNPRSLVSVLQSMVKNPASFTSTKKEDKSQAWLAEIEKSNKKKYYALKFFLPRSRDAVMAREKTKSLLIRTIHVFRLAYRRLAELLVRDGLIPDADLIFYFTQSELQQLIFSNQAGLILKANRRRKLHPELDSLVFPELSLGVPKEIQDSTDDSMVLPTGVQLTGTPVFKGTVRATARVALNLEEAKQIKHGDILITRSTDIGWSPYFPLLSGVVTELGGLISHGAVIAREYGLPAVVGCQKVTQMFRSGDVVVLDGTKGTITRVEAAQ